MLKHYLKIAIRNLLWQKGYSLINVAGLTIGTACCILIMLWVQDELSFDKFHKHGDCIYLLGMKQQLESGEHVIATQQAPMGQYVKDRVPQVENFTRLFFYPRTLQVGEIIHEEYVAFTDPALFSMFTFPLIAGDPETAFDDPYSVVMTREAAQRYFGEEDPIGKSVLVNNKDAVRVTGILADILPNSVLEEEIVFPFQFAGIQGYNITEWAGADFYTYLQLRQGASLEQVIAKIQTLSDDLDYERYTRENNPYRMFAHPLERLHLYALGGEGGFIQYVYIFSAAAVIILMIACINFINISTARSARRAREIGLRKVFGAQRGNLVRQLLLESICLALAAFLIALMLAEIFLPAFNNLAKKELAINLNNSAIIFGLLLIAVTAGILSGSYPAFYLSRFLPVKSLTGQTKSGKSGFTLRRILVVIQFSLSLILIGGTLVIGRQIHYLHNKDLGIEKDNVVYFWSTSSIKEHYHAFKNDVLQNPAVSNVTASAQNIFHINSTIGNNWHFEGRDPAQRLELHFDWVTGDYAETFDIQMAAGRFYSPAQFPTDTVDGIVLNERAVTMMGLKDPIGKKFSYWGRNCRIIGVMKDFHLEPLYETLKPMILIYNNFNSVIYIRIAPENTPENLAYIQETLKKYEPGGQFSLRFLDATYRKLYQNEERLRSIVSWAAVLAIFTACLGLLGLVAFATEQRKKEIGVRKVLGASVTSIITLFSKESIVLILIANLIAWPVAYYFVSRWLENFAYRADLPLWIFLTTGLSALIIAIATVSYQAFRAATANPVDSLRYE